MSLGIEKQFFNTKNA